MSQKRLFWPFWPVISETGWTSRKKVPLGIRLKSARRRRTRLFYHTSARGPEAKFLVRGCGDWLWHFQGRPGLVDLSKTLVGTFFRRVHPGSEMAGQNGKNGLFCQNDQKDQNGLVF